MKWLLALLVVAMAVTLYYQKKQIGELTTQRNWATEQLNQQGLEVTPETLLAASAGNAPLLNPTKRSASASAKQPDWFQHHLQDGAEILDKKPSACRR